MTAAFQSELTLTNKAVSDIDGGESEALTMNSFVFDGNI